MSNGRTRSDLRLAPGQDLDKAKIRYPARSSAVIESLTGSYLTAQDHRNARLTTTGTMSMERSATCSSRTSRRSNAATTASVRMRMRTAASMDLRASAMPRACAIPGPARRTIAT